METQRVLRLPDIKRRHRGSIKRDAPLVKLCKITETTDWLTTHFHIKNKNKIKKKKIIIIKEKKNRKIIVVVVVVAVVFVVGGGVVVVVVQVVVRELKVTFCIYIRQQFGPSSGLTKCSACSGSKLFPMVVIGKEINRFCIHSQYMSKFCFRVRSNK